MYASTNMENQTVMDCAFHVIVTEIMNIISLIRKLGKRLEYRAYKNRIFGKELVYANTSTVMM